jgi:hypothetical protein
MSIKMDLPNPYVGPRPFQTGEKLFGRDKEVVELANRLAARRVVLLHAPSGAGKTSLVQAGLVPYLQGKGFWTPHKVRMNTGFSTTPKQYNRYMFSVFASLLVDWDQIQKPAGPVHPAPIMKAVVELRALINQPGMMQRPAMAKKVDGAVQILTGDSKAPAMPDLIWLLEKIYQVEQQVGGAGGAAEKINAAPRGMLVFFDQFEEFLTLDPTDRPAKEEFLEWLMPALYDMRWQFLFSMREDHIAGLEPYIQYFPDRLSARYRLDFLNREAAIQAIKLPAQQLPQGAVAYETGVVEQLVGDLQRVRLQEAGQVTESLGQSVEPVQLQVVCSNLWQVRRRDPFYITKREVKALGGVDDALGDYYNHWVAQVAKGAKAPEEKLRNWLEYALTTPSGLRNQALAGEEAAYGLAPASLKGLVDAWIIREERRGGRTWYELTHDRMVEPLKQANAKWRATNVSPFRPQAERWQAGDKPNSLLLLGAALQEAQSWAKAHPRLVIPLESEYMARSDEQRKETERVVRAEYGTDLDQRGWGVIFAAKAGASPGERGALLPLLEHRWQQAAGNYREFIGGDGYRAGESAREFLERHGIGFRSLDPAQMPYYLLIVGDPQTIPFEFQYDLSLQFAVGRIQFETLAEYNQYARSVVFSETLHENGSFSLPKRLVIFGPAHEGDPATKMGLEKLSKPLLEALTKNQPDWRIDALLVEEAKRERLGHLLGGGETPAVFFFSGHAINFPDGAPDQFSKTGSLVCQDYPGPRWFDDKTHKFLAREFYFSAEDVGEAGLLGMMAFLFGASTAGSPQMDNFPRETRHAAVQIAPKAFLSRLPQRLLSDVHGGALAVIGHVERAWIYSFVTKAGSDVEIYEGVLGRLMRGYTAGLAMQAILQRYTILAALLSEILFAEAMTGKAVDPLEFKRRRDQAIDARNYILIGDPAVRLPLGSALAGEAKVERPILPEVDVPDEWRKPLQEAEAKEEAKPPVSSANPDSSSGEG